MRALTIKQPWADAIAYGGKDVENRTWALPSKHIGSRVLLHAGRTYDPMGRFIITDWAMLRSWPDARGAVIAVATLAGCHFADDCCAPWGAPGAHHWQLTHVTALSNPVPCKGRLGLWTPAPAVQQATAINH